MFERSFRPGDFTVSPTERRRSPFERSPVAPDPEWGTWKKREVTEPRKMPTRVPESV